MATKAGRDVSLSDENVNLRARLEEAEATLQAIRRGEVDAVVVGEQIYMLTTAEAASNQLRGRALSEVSDAVITIDNDSRVTWMNAAAAQRYSIAPEHALGRLIGDIYENRWLRPEDEVSARVSLAEKGYWRGESVHHLRGGTNLHVESSVSVLRDDAGRRVGVLTVIRDITARKHAESEREELLTKESNAREAAELAMRAKDEFLATVSHELRTPLSAILGWAAMLQRGTLDEPAAAAAIETIVRNARAQAQLIEDLLDAARIMSGKLKPELEPVELTSVVNTAVESLRHAALAKNILLTVNIDTATYRVHGDTARLQQVISNLLANALKFTPNGGRVEVALTRDNTLAHVSVSDSGEGIPVEFLPYVFDRFRQADGTTTRKHGGLGLGLAIVRHLVQMHGGSVEAFSAGVGKGASFVIHLPLVTAPQIPRRPARLGVHDPGVAVVAKGGVLQGVRILEVDDEADSRDVIREALEQYGAQVVTAASAAEALEALSVFRPDVLVCDIGMPGEDGFSFMRRLRSVDENRGIPAIALTGYAGNEERLRALDVGYQGFVPKPVELDNLVSVIAGLVGRS